MAFMRGEMDKCDPFFLGQLMADHANLDYRDLLPAVQVRGGGMSDCVNSSLRCVCEQRVYMS